MRICQFKIQYVVLPTGLQAKIHVSTELCSTLPLIFTAENYLENNYLSLAYLT